MARLTYRTLAVEKRVKGIGKTILGLPNPVCCVTGFTSTSVIILRHKPIDVLMGPDKTKTTDNTRMTR
jgi:hypothetical protein